MYSLQKYKVFPAFTRTRRSLEHAQFVLSDVRQDAIQSDFTSKSRDFSPCRFWQFLSLHVLFPAQAVHF